MEKINRYTFFVILLVGCSYQKKPQFTEEKLIQPTVYLTSDDGPVAGTEQLLQVAEEEQVPITFFLIGSQLDNDEQNGTRLKMLKSSNFAFLANHSFSHALYYDRFYSEPSYILSDFLKNEKKLGLSATSRYSRIPARNLFSLPDNLVNRTELFESELIVESKVYAILIKNGFSLIGWDYYWDRNIRTGRPDPEDGRLAAAEALAMLDKGKTVKPGKLVVILHDDMFSERFGGGERLRVFIKSLRSQELEFMPLDVY